MIYTGAIVRAFDVRPVTKEQVESMGATFLEVAVQEDGSGSGGYAKEMSDDFKKAQNQMMLEQAKDVDIIITTALIPGRKAPILVDQTMLDVMKPGSVCVDLAAANGGNVAQTRPNEIVETRNGVKIIGYTDLPSRLAATASNLVCFVYALFQYFGLIHSDFSQTLSFKIMNIGVFGFFVISLEIMLPSLSSVLGPRRQKRRGYFKSILMMMPCKIC